jgi:hypothetical protein
MPFLPPWRFQMFDEVGCHALDWTETFRADANAPGRPTPGAMRGFHVVFRARVQRAGLLVFFDSDGSIIRRNGTIVHEDRESHPVRRHELAVRLGDHLEIAHWQLQGNWIWGARSEFLATSLEDLLVDVQRYRHAVEQALANPNGPTLKVYTSASAPARAAMSIYSLALNGYRPAGIQVFGDYQWDPRSARIMKLLLPFAEIVPTSQLDCTLARVDPRLVALAHSRWSAMKICTGLFYPPHEYCFLDDDIFVVDPVDDALRLYEEHMLVYAPDREYLDAYRAVRHPASHTDPDRPLLANMSTGFYLIRNLGDLQAQSNRLLNTSADGHRGCTWEQGFFAWEFAREKTAVLPTQRYFCPLFDGLPGGLRGYDWQSNPCQFAFVHFGGPAPKPTDDDAGALVHDILGRHRAAP